MPITRTPIIDDDNTGTSGTIINNAWKQEFYDQIDGVVTPATALWTTIPFNAANFSATAPLTWTVGSGAVLRNRYAVAGKVLFWSMYISWFSGGNVLGGSPGPSLKIAVPLNTLGQQMQVIDYCAVPGVATIGGLFADISSTHILIAKSAGGNFALSDTPGMIFTIMMEVFNAHGGPLSPQGDQANYTERPLRVYGEQYHAGGALPIGARTDAPGGAVVPPYVLGATGIYYQLQENDWVISNRYTGAAQEVISAEEFSERFGHGGGPPLPEGT